MTNPAPLVPDETQPGLWVNPRWRAGTPGLFAVVIGVSDYEHLPDPNDQFTPRPYGLNKLAVSALTALRIFEWLQKGYFVPGCPVAKCWVLLAPTAAEMHLVSEFASHSSLPTFSRCQTALRAWHRELSGLNGSVGDASRSFFFFSGHGLEVLHDHHVLLPSDWLHSGGIEDDALCVQNLRHGLSEVDVVRQFFFIDACRGDHDALCKRNITGQRILPVPALVRGTNPNLVVPILHATSAGQSAWQRESPNDGLSLFGDALQDGLRGLPPLSLTESEHGTSVKLYPLQEFVEDHVKSRLSAVNAKLSQPVRLGGSTRNETVTVMPSSPQVTSPA